MSAHSRRFAPARDVFPVDNSYGSPTAVIRANASRRWAPTSQILSLLAHNVGGDRFLKQSDTDPINVAGGAITTVMDILVNYLSWEITMVQNQYWRGARRPAAQYEQSRSH